MGGAETLLGLTNCIANTIISLKTIMSVFSGQMTQLREMIRQEPLAGVGA